MLEYLEKLTFKIYAITLIPVLIMIFVVGSLWNLYFIKTARLKYKCYKKWHKLARTDVTNTYAEGAYCYRTEFNKNLLLLSINLLECSTVVLYGISYGLAEWLYSINQSFLFPQRETNNCSQLLMQHSNVEIYWITEIPIGLFLISIAQGAIIYSLVLSICLMKYIHAREYNQSSDYKKRIKRFLSIMILIVTCLIVLGTVPQLVLTQRVIEPIVLIIVYWKWVKQIRIFHQTLKMLAFDCQTNRRRRDVCKSANTLVKQFKIIMSLNIISFGLLLLTELIAQFNLLVTIGLYYGPCLFHYLYGTAIYTPLIHSKYQVELLENTNISFYILERSLLGIATDILGSHFFTASALFLANKCTNGLKRKYRTRFTPDLNNPLLIQPEK